jgi:trans-aconitate methyltransferase
MCSTSSGSFQVTGLDLSPTMLDLAATLNPECDFVKGDMRDFSSASDLTPF